MQEIVQFGDMGDEAWFGFLVDFILVDSTKISKEFVVKLLPKEIRYHGILDFNYVFQCVSKNKMLDYTQFLIPEKSQELENYLRVREEEMRI